MLVVPMKCSYISTVTHLSQVILLFPTGSTLLLLIITMLGGGSDFPTLWWRATPALDGFSGASHWNSPLDGGVVLTDV